MSSRRGLGEEAMRVLTQDENGELQISNLPDSTSVLTEDDLRMQDFGVRIPNTEASESIIERTTEYTDLYNVVQHQTQQALDRAQEDLIMRGESAVHVGNEGEVLRVDPQTVRSQHTVSNGEGIRAQMEASNTTMYNENLSIQDLEEALTTLSTNSTPDWNHLTSSNHLGNVWYNEGTYNISSDAIEIDNRGRNVNEIMQLEGEEFIGVWLEIRDDYKIPMKYWNAFTKKCIENSMAGPDRIKNYDSENVQPQRSSNPTEYVHPSGAATRGRRGGASRDRA